MGSSTTLTTPSQKVSCQSLSFSFSPMYCDIELTRLSLPTGTALPGGAVLPMSSVADFPMVLPQGMYVPGPPIATDTEVSGADGTGTKLPGGVMVPIVMQKKDAPKAGDTKDPGPICSIQ